VNPRIGKLEALLARIKSNATASRTNHTTATVSEPPMEVDMSETIEAVSERAPEVEAPLESRARLVAAPRAADAVEVDEIEAEEILELDDRHVVREETPAPAQAGNKSIDAFAATTEMNVSNLPVPEEPDAPPPSSRRPIAEPAETPQEAQISVVHTPPPESGKQVAADALTFDDDLTGVREAQPPRVSVPTQEPSIQLQSLRSPPTAVPSAPDEMEVDLASPGEATAPPPGPLPELRAPRVESAQDLVAADVTRPTRPVAAAQVAEMAGTVKPSSPKSFGELLDSTLAL
jgi:hypothetical protein